MLRIALITAVLALPTLLARVASSVSARLGRESALVRALRPAYEWLLDAASL